MKLLVFFSLNYTNKIGKNESIAKGKEIYMFVQVLKFMFGRFSFHLSNIKWIDQLFDISGSVDTS